jgi:potassium-transporting ATPase KdpC subunit
MTKHLLISLRALFVLTIITGICYPLLITGIVQLAFPFQSNGSIVHRNGKIIGSSLVGQTFESDRYFSSRPSATGNSALPSGGSNLGPTSKTLADSIAVRKARFIAKNHTAVVPPDMLTASASGLDPHIAPASAYAQAMRISMARRFDSLQTVKLRQLIDKHVETPELHLFGEARVNVLLLNLALDSEFR